MFFENESLKAFLIKFYMYILDIPLDSDFSLIFLSLFFWFLCNDDIGINFAWPNILPLWIHYLVYAGLAKIYYINEKYVANLLYLIFLYCQCKMFIKLLQHECKFVYRIWNVNPHFASFHWNNTSCHFSLPQTAKTWQYFIDGLVQERPNSSALAMELRPSCTSPSIYNQCHVCW